MLSFIENIGNFGIVNLILRLEYKGKREECKEKNHLFI
jgi:hypothetical protein